MKTSTHSLDYRKTIQAATLLANLEPKKTISKMRLLKLLYIADREALLEIGRTISGDSHSAMRKGPILSQFYNIIKGESEQSAHFEKCFKVNGFRLELIKPAGNGFLNRYEIRKLKALSEKYANTDDEDLSEITHEFEEWINNKPEGNWSNSIPLDDMLAAIGKTKERETIRKRLKSSRAVNELWG